MVDTALKQSLNQKIQDNEFTAADIPDYFTIFCQLGNEIEDLQDEVDGWGRRVQVVMDGLGIYWIAVEGGRFATGEGPLQEPDLTLAMAADEAALIFTGRKNAESAFMAGTLRVQGDLPDAIKMHSLIEIVLEEIEY